jgi:phytoene dehydrogenase-like protein
LTGKLVREIGLATEWIKMDPVDQFHVPGLPVFSVPAEFGPYVEKLKAWFPDESANIDAYFEELRQAYMYGLLYYFRGVANDQVERLEKFSMVERLDAHFRDARLKILLMGDAPHWGSLPDRTSYVFDAMLRLSYFLGNYYPKGSSQKFADDLGRALVEKGGRILKCAEVCEILAEGGRCSGVRIRTVSKREPEEFLFEAPVIVSNADALHTYRDLIGEEYRSAWMLEHLESLKTTFACFLTHIGLRGMDPEQLAAAEGYYWNECDVSDIMKNVFKIFIPTHFDPAIAPAGCQTLIVQRPSPAQFDEVRDWNAHRAEVEARTMAALRRVLPDIEQHIVTKSSATAMTSVKFTNNRQGGMLGWEMSPQQLGSNRLPVFTPIENLYLTGHWTQPGGGITPVIVSAQRVAKIILTGKDEGRDLASAYFNFNARPLMARMEDVRK